MAQVKFKRGLFANRGTAVNGMVYFATDTLELWMANADGENGWRKYGDGDERVKDVAYADGIVTITYENGKTATTYASLASVSDTAVENQFVTGISAENGVVSATRSGITSSQVTRTATAKVAGTDVETALGNLADAIQTGGTGSVVTVEEVTTGLDDSVLKAYKIWQGSHEDASNLKGTINIPKDLVVTSGSLVNGTWSGDKFTEGSGTDKAIKLVIANQSTPIYINTTDLVDIYTAGPGITVTDNKISNDIDTTKGLMFTGSGDAAKTAVNVKANDKYIEINSNGAIASKDIDSAIATAVNTAKATIDDYTVNGKKISTNPVLDGSNINVDDTAATKETVKAAIERLTTAAANASDKVDTEIAKLDGTATASGTASAASGVTKTSYINVLNKVDEVNGKLNEVGSGSTQTAVDVAGAANAAYNDAVSYTDTKVAGLDAEVNDTCSAVPAAANGVTKTSYVSVANGVTVTEVDGKLTSVALTEASADAAGAANAAYTDAVAYTNDALTWIEA